MTDLLTTRPGATDPRARLADYQRLVAGSPAWPAATIAPDLDDASVGEHPADLPGLRALAADAWAWPAGTIAPDLD